MIDDLKSMTIPLILILCLITAPLQAQFIIKQSEYTVPLSYSLVPEDAPIESEEDEMIFFMAIPADKLRQAALEEGNEVVMSEQILYSDGENYAVEYSSEDGKITVVANSKDGIMYNIIWAQKRVLVLTPEDMKKMEEQANAAVEEMLKNMPPETRAQVKAQMEKETQQKSGAQSTVRPTGKKMTINGYKCELYILEGEENDITGVWAAADNMKISAELEKITAKFARLFETEDGEDMDEWSLVSGKIPVEVRQMSPEMSMGEPAFEITSVEKIEQKKPSADKFYVPSEKDGFTRGSYAEMMQQIMPGQN